MCEIKMVAQINSNDDINQMNNLRKLIKLKN